MTTVTSERSDLSCDAPELSESTGKSVRLHESDKHQNSEVGQENLQFEYVARLQGEIGRLNGIVSVREETIEEYESRLMQLTSELNAAQAELLDVRHRYEKPSD